MVSGLYFLVNKIVSVLLGLTDRCLSVHHFSTPCNTRCMMSLRIYRTLPTMTITPSSAKPCAKTPCLLSHLSKLSATKDHRSGDRHPPCGRPHFVIAYNSKSPARTHTLHCCNSEDIHCRTAKIILRSLSAFSTDTIGLLSKAPWMSKKTPRAYCPASSARSTLPTS